MALDVGTGGMPRAGGRLRLAAAAIFKNEGPYILEWVAHHRALGIDRFFIADNDSTDETSATLAALARVGIVEHLPFPSASGRPPQQAAYGEIIRRYRDEADWIAFLDADEFLVPAMAHRSLATVIAALDPGPDVGAIAVNWAIYGSAGQREAGARPVTERFDRRADQTHPVNRHYKSIVRPTAVDGKIQNPHYFPLKPGFRNVHSDGSAVAEVAGLPKGLSQRILWDPLRINHYVIKSWDEFYHRKRARGRATRSDMLRGETFFRTHDRNDVLDPMPRWLTEAAEAEGRRIEAILRGRAAQETPPAWKSLLTKLIHLAPAASRGAIESVEIQGDTALIRGWALTPRRKGAESFAVAVDARPVKVASQVRTRRSDVIARFPRASAECGFTLKVAWPLPAEQCRRPVPVTVVARYNRESSFELALPPGAGWRVVDLPSLEAATAPQSARGAVQALASTR